MLSKADEVLMEQAAAARQAAARRKLPEVAEDAATVYVGSDRYPASVLGDDGGLVTVQYDDDVVVSGSVVDGSAKYEYYRANGPVRHFKRNKKGRYVEVVRNEQTGRYNQSGYSGGLYIGRRSRYYDPHF